MTTKLKIITVTGLTGAMTLLSGQASAHVVYPAALYDDTGTNPAHVTTTPSLTAPGTSTKTFTATSNVGFYEASSTGLAQANAAWNPIQVAHGAAASPITTANSHDSKFLFFDLAQESKVTFAVNANTTVAQTGTKDFQPAFSIYSGLAPYLSHDGAANPDSIAHTLALDPDGFAPWSQFSTTGTPNGNTYAGSVWGQYRSDANFSIGHDTIKLDGGTNGQVGSPVTAYPNGDPLNGFDFGSLNLVGYATNDGKAFGDISHTGSGVGGSSVTATFDLLPGVYTLTVGGNNSALLDGYLNALFASAGLPFGSETCTACSGRTPDITAFRKSFGFDITTTVAPVPVPAAIWFFGSALGGLGLLGRRKVNS